MNEISNFSTSKQSCLPNIPYIHELKWTSLINLPKNMIKVVWASSKESSKCLNMQPKHQVCEMITRQQKPFVSAVLNTDLENAEKNKKGSKREYSWLSYSENLSTFRITELN